jgi:hypothetical protein
MGHRFDDVLFHHALGDAQLCGDLRMRALLEFMKEKNLTAFRRQLLNRATEKLDLLLYLHDDVLIGRYDQVLLNLF